MTFPRTEAVLCDLLYTLASEADLNKMSADEMLAELMESIPDRRLMTDREDALSRFLLAYISMWEAFESLSKA